MNEKTDPALIGQLSADALLLQALTTVVIANHPKAMQEIEQLVEAAAPIEQMRLPESAQAAFSLRIQELRVMWQK